MVRRFFLPFFCLGLLLFAEPATLVAQQERPARQTAVQYHYSGNTQSRKYHNSGCRYFRCKACTARFVSAREAVRQGYVACKICGG